MASRLPWLSDWTSFSIRSWFWLKRRAHSVFSKVLQQLPRGSHSCSLPPQGPHIHLGSTALNLPLSCSTVFKDLQNLQDEVCAPQPGRPPWSDATHIPSPHVATSQQAPSLQRQQAPATPLPTSQSPPASHPELHSTILRKFNSPRATWDLPTPGCMKPLSSASPNLSLYNKHDTA